MPLNKLEYAQILQNKLDQQIVQESTTGWIHTYNTKEIK